MKLEQLLLTAMLSCNFEFFFPERQHIPEQPPRQELEVQAEESEGEGYAYTKEEKIYARPHDAGIPDTYPFIPDLSISPFDLGRADARTISIDASVEQYDASPRHDAGLDAEISSDGGCIRNPELEPCDGIDNDGDGEIDRSIIRGWSKRACPVRCYQTDTHTYQEFIDYRGIVTQTISRSDFCVEEVYERPMAHFFCGYDPDCIGEWSFINYRYCENIGLRCVDDDGDPDLSISDQSDNMPARCGE